MKHALVTGGSGYIGRRLISALVSNSVSVRATARTEASAKDLAALGAEVLAWSLNDPVFPAEFLRGTDTVYHLAAPRRTYDPHQRKSSRPGDPVFVEGSARLAAAFAASDVRRLIVTSSTAVHGKHWGEADETSKIDPQNQYARNRCEVEQLCRSALVATPGRLVIARLTETFGTLSPGQLDLLTAIVTGRFRLIGTGRVLHHFSTVEDTVSGLLALGQTEAAAGAVLNIGSPSRTFRAFVDAASAATNQPVRETPWAGSPAAALLWLMRSNGALSRRFGGLYGVLDYQLRPRAFSMRRSTEILGNYATTDFAAAVAESAHAAMESIAQVASDRHMVRENPDRQ